MFWGGEDIWPGIYGEKPTHSYNAPKLSQRDHAEMVAYYLAKKRKVPMFGICRGAQILCALSGGKLWQHVDKHGQNHEIIMKDTKETIMITSTHHQMMRPTPDMQILGVSASVRSPKKYNEEGEHTSTEDEAEIVFIPSAKALCIQGHPEYTPLHSDFSHLTRKLINNYLFA